MAHLFLFTIGPVQSFIAQARKTQDLYAGSKILSDLITFAMDTLESLAVKTNVGFIFPNHTSTTDSKPNRFIAIVNADKAQIKKIGGDLEIAVMNEFATGKDFGRLVNVIFDCEDQFRDFLKINWIAKKFDEKPEKYKDEIATLERLMGAVKNTRQFASFPETGRKCAVNGEYNVRFYRLSENDKKRVHEKFKNKGYEPSFDEIKGDICTHKLFISNKDSVCIIDEIENFAQDKVYMRWLQNGEGICGITFLKRLYEDKELESFPSTAKIALLAMLTHSELKTKADSYINQIRNHQRSYADEQLYYKENLDKDYLNKRGLKGISDIKTIETFKTQLESLESEAKDLGLQFSKYYAILVFDADSMGSKLANCKSQVEHTDLSTLLREFAKKATQLINGDIDYEFKDKSKTEKIERGKTVYAGGDDFLGFLNLNCLFEAMGNLRKLFDEEVNDKLINQALRLTFSAGIAIAHYKTPLSEVLNYARAMEKKAKNIDGKDSFAIAVLKHSGEIHETVFKWTYQSEVKTLWTTEVAKTLTNYLACKELSDKFITNLSIEFESLMGKDGKLVGGRLKQDIPELNGIFKVELARLVKRASKLDDSKLKPLVKDLFSIYEKSKNENKLSLQNFLNFLHICEFIGRNLNISQPVTTKQNVD